MNTKNLNRKQKICPNTLVRYVTTEWEYRKKKYHDLGPGHHIWTLAQRDPSIMP